MGKSAAATAGGSSLIMLGPQATLAEGDIADQEAKTESQLIGVQAKQKELNRTKRLNEAIASQIVSAGASGIQMEGTPAETIGADVLEAREAQEAEATGVKLTQRAIRSRGKQAKRASRVKAANQLIQTGMQAGGAFV